MLARVAVGLGVGLGVALGLFAGSAAHAAPAGRVTGTVRVTEADGKPVTNPEVIVYVVGAEPAAPAARPAGAPVAQIRQRGRRFVPELVAVTVGDKVEFPNDDPFLHNVFSQSPPRKFDLGSFKKGDSKARELTSPGVVDVYCNIHPEMAATILVLPSRHHTRVAADGSFALEGIPPGAWRVFAYTRRAPKPTMAMVNVAPGAAATIALSLVRGGEKPHVNKYGEKYRPEKPQTYR